MTAFIANTNVLELIGLQNEIDSTFINAASVSVTIKDAAGVNVPGQVWPLAMNYVLGSDGNYRAFLMETLPLSREKYIAYINASGGVNLVGHWEFQFKPLARIVTEPI